MRKVILPAAAAAALTVVALGAAPANAQFVVTSGYYSQGYSGGYSPYSDGGTRIVIGGGVSFGTYPAYSAYPGYGYSPSYGGGYGPYHGVRYSPYYGGGYTSYYGGGYTDYPSGYRVRYSGGWRR